MCLSSFLIDLQNSHQKKKKKEKEKEKKVDLSAVEKEVCLSLKK